MLQPLDILSGTRIPERPTEREGSARDAETIDNGEANSNFDKDGLARENIKLFMPRADSDYSDKITDIFALGSTFYYILQGYEPFPDLDPFDNEEQIQLRFISRQFPELKSLKMSYVTHNCWKGEYNSAEAVLQDLGSDATCPLADGLREEAMQLGNLASDYASRPAYFSFYSDPMISNIILTEKEDDGFLIDLDLAIKTGDNQASGAPSKTGTKIFMAMGTLLGDPHTFMHDLESFFWVFFWICIHYGGLDNMGKIQRRVVSKYEKWKYADIGELAEWKKGVIDDESDFD
ncbi:MAG: hypothetical protein Q9217_006794 [Psora testacea]